MGLLLSLFGFAATAYGLYRTYQQAKDANNAAEISAEELAKFKVRTQKADAYRDLSEAQYALEMTKKHLNNDAWSDAGDSYEDARRAIIRVKAALPTMDDGIAEALNNIELHGRKFCEQIDIGLAKKGELPDKAKTLAAIRESYGTMFTIQNSIEV